MLGFPGYCADAGGHIWSCKQKKYLQPRPSSGYLRVDLYRGGRHHWKLIHRLVLEAFIGPCPDGMEACHNNGDRTDNRLENLRWDTRSANQKDAVRHGTHAGFGRKGEKHPLSRLTETQVRELVRRREAGAPLIAISSHYGVSRGCVNDIIHRRTWRHLWEDNAT